MIGRIAGNYWAVPVIEGIEGTPRSDQLKHFGASMASFGSIALFHLAGHYAGSLQSDRRRPTPICRAFALPGPTSMPCRNPITPTIRVDVVVFSAPQLSLYELRDLAGLCDGRRFTVPLLAVTSPAGQAGRRPHGIYGADRIRRRQRAVGNVFLSVLCARDFGGQGWKRLATNSAKLVNILGGYGYRPMLASMEACVDAAISGKLERT